MNQLEKYFHAEKNESILFVTVGILAISTAIYFLVQIKLPFYNGLSYPLLLVALIQITIGSTIYLRSPKDLKRVSEFVNSNKSKIQSEEIPRMIIVMKNFEYYKWLEISLLAWGIGMFLYFNPSSLWKGLGLGLIIQSAFLLILDFFAENRGKVYLEYLNSL
ncbi:MAG: hypothetical protein ACOVP1_06275 [Bacteroidia bacterium]